MESRSNPENKHGYEISATAFAGMLALLVAVAFGDVLFGFKTFVIRDYGICTYPIAWYQRECFWNGEFPLWNPLNSFGVPFLAGWSMLCLYPPALIYLILPMPWSLSFFCLAHLWLAGMGMFFLARNWTGNSVAAAFAGIVFAFNGMMLNALMWPGFLAAMAWMPWVVWRVRESWAGGGRKLAAAAVAGALQMLTGGPEAIAFTWIFLSLLLLVECLEGRALKIILRFVFVVFLVSMLAAPQLLPFLELLANSQRSTGYGNTTWAMPSWGWGNFLVPMFHYYRSGSEVFFQNEQPWTSSYYVGVVAIFCAGLALWTNRSRRTWLLAGCTLVFIVLSMGPNFFLYPALRAVFPQIGFMRFPIKFAVLATFTLPLLAAFGFPRLIGGPGEKRSGLWIPGGVLLLVIAGIVGWAKVRPYENEVWSAVVASGIKSGLFLAAAIGLAWAVERGKVKPRWAAGGVLLVVFLDLVLAHVPSQNPRVAPDVYAPGLMTEKLKPVPRFGESRAFLTRKTHDKLYTTMLADTRADYLGRRLGLFANCNLLDGIASGEGFFPMYLEKTRHIWAEVFTSTETNNIDTGLTRFLGISQMSDPEDFLAWQHRTNYLPLITVGAKPEFRNEDETYALMAKPEFDATETVYLPVEARTTIAATRQSSAKLLNAEYKAELVSAKISAPAPAMAVIAQSYYKSWKAYVDGNPVPLWRANYAFQALEVPAGEHVVTLRYEDREFRMGLVLCAGGGLILAGLAFCGRRPGGLGSNPNRAGAVESEDGVL